MERAELISTLRTVVKWNEELVKSIEERKEEIRELKELVKELKEAHRLDVKNQARLMEAMEKMTNQVSDLTAINQTLQQKVDDLTSRLSVSNKVRFGSTSQKGIKKNAAPVQDREKDKDEFDGTNGAAMSTASQAEPVSFSPKVQLIPEANTSLLTIRYPISYSTTTR